MNSPLLYSRLIEARIAEALADTPVVLVAGPRQAGKTTLVRQMATQEMLPNCCWPSRRVLMRIGVLVGSC